MPDLTLSFVNPRLLDDVSFHPCVRFKRWEVGAAFLSVNVMCTVQFDMQVFSECL